MLLYLRITLIGALLAVCGCGNKPAVPPSQPPAAAQPAAEPEPAEVAEARKLKDRGDTPGATKKLEQYLKTNPSSAAAHVAIARCYFDQGSIPNARKHLEEAVRLRPNDAKAWRVLGNVLYRAQLHAESEKAIQRAAQLQPDDVDILLDLGREQLLLHRYPDAAKTFHHALDIAPNNPNAQFEMADYLLAVHSGEADLKEAERLLGRAAEANPERAGTFALLGKVELELNNPRGAVDAFNAAVKLAPENADNWFALGRAFRRIGNEGLAGNALKTAEKLRKVETEIAQVESQEAQMPKDPAIKLKLGRMYEAAGNLDGAASYYQACLALQPNNATARQRLNAIKSQAASQPKSP